MSRRIERGSESATSVSAPPTSTSSMSITEQLCQQLTESVTALASHARELRVARACQRNQTARSRLAQLDESLSAIEERAQALVDIVNAEHDALETVQAQLQLAKEHHQYLLALQENMMRNDTQHGSRDDDDKEPSSTVPAPLVQVRPHTPGQSKQGEQENRVHTSVGSNESDTVTIQKKNLSHQHPNYHPKRFSNDHPAGRNTHQQKKAPPPQQHQHHHHHMVELRGPEEPITLEELEHIPRTTRGRISLYVLNDALSDIAAHCRRARRRQKKKPKSIVLTNSYSQHQHQQKEDNNDSCVVGEQELRQSCSFFRTGESTARSILLILRTLGRLQQIPAKNGEVTYIVGP